MKKYMVKLIVQTAVIVAVSMGVALFVNSVRSEPLPVLEKFSSRNVLDQEDVNISEVDAETLKNMIESDLVYLIDARSEFEYRHARIPGAVSLFIGESDERVRSFLKQIPEEKTVVTYCSNIYCKDSLQLAVRLFRQGITDLMVFRGGIEQWQASGFDIESTEELNADYRNN